MDVRTGSGSKKLWGYSKRPRNWKKIMYKVIDEIIPVMEEIIPEIDEIIPVVNEIIPLVEEIIIPIVEEIMYKEIEAPEDDKPEEAPIGPSHESEVSIEKPKITATVSNPDSSFSHM